MSRDDALRSMHWPMALASSHSIQHALARRGKAQEILNCIKANGNIARVSFCMDHRAIIV